MKKEVIVIGAGASGLMAAITAARHGCKVTVLEHMNRIGRKLQITGNGKCNFTNEKQDISCYHTSDKRLAACVLEQFPLEKTIAFFQQIGILPTMKNGCYYPYSEQASSIVDALRMEAERLSVKLACNIHINKLEKKKGQGRDRFLIDTDGYLYESDALIIAAGSMAAPNTGSDGSGYKLAESFGHSLIQPVPALVQFLSKEREIAKLAGLRMKGEVHLFINKIEQAAEQGEIQFIKDGLSGIPVFQVSHLASRALNGGYKSSHVYVELNLLPGFSEKELRQFIAKRIERHGKKPLQAFLIGLFHEKMIRALKERMEVRGELPLAAYDEAQITRLLSLLRHFRFSIYGTHSFEQAQVCAGGVSLRELKEGTLESKLVSNLYFAGEILDVDGMCGGYNLQWAWASGAVAGENAAKDAEPVR